MRMQWNRTTIYKSLNLSVTITTTPPFCCCEDSTRTSDLKVMSLASYQLLHFAINYWLATQNRTTAFCGLRILTTGVLPLHHDEINVQLLTGVIQNQYWAIWILQLRALLGQKDFLSPGYPSLQRFEKWRKPLGVRCQLNDFAFFLYPARFL